jgi:hypothetical protein
MIVFFLEYALAYYNAGGVAVNLKAVGLAPDLFAALPNVFSYQIIIIFAEKC